VCSFFFLFFPLTERKKGLSFAFPFLESCFLTRKPFPAASYFRNSPKKENNCCLVATKRKDEKGRKEERKNKKKMRTGLVVVALLVFCFTTAVVKGQSDQCCMIDTGCDSHCPREGRVMSELYGHTTCGDPCLSQSQVDQPDTNITLPRHENISGMRTVPTAPRNTIRVQDFRVTLSFMQKVFDDRLRMYSRANDAVIENLRATRVTNYIDPSTLELLIHQYDRDHLLYSFFLGAEGGDRTMVHLANGCPTIDNKVCFIQPTQPNTVTVQVWLLYLSLDLFS
jgi:hypothetical protein